MSQQEQSLLRFVGGIALVVLVYGLLVYGGYAAIKLALRPGRAGSSPTARRSGRRRSRRASGRMARSEADEVCKLCSHPVVILLTDKRCKQ